MKWQWLAQDYIAPYDLPVSLSAHTQCHASHCNSKALNKLTIMFKKTKETEGLERWLSD